MVVAFGTGDSQRWGSSFVNGRGLAAPDEGKSLGCVQGSIVIIGLAFATFVSTSVDNLFLLVGFLTSPGFRARSAMFGYTGAVIVVLGVGLAASYAADFAPNRYVGYLGVVPMAMGVTQLYRAVRHRSAEVTASQPLAHGAFSVGLVMVANSGDSLAAFVALFAETREPFTFLIVAVGVILSLAWYGLARWITVHVSLQRLLQRWGRYLLPVFLILVGAYILADTRTDTLDVAAPDRVEVIGLGHNGSARPAGVMSSAPDR